MKHGRHNYRLYALVTLCLVLAGVFAALGVWQVKRLQWKQVLIERVDANLVAEPLHVDAGAALTGLETLVDEYRRLTIQGHVDCDRALSVRATTALGSGYWLMTPVRLADSRWLWVNQGFAHTTPTQSLQCGPSRFRGLLRSSQTDAGPFRRNDPKNLQWYSRDIDAMSKAIELPDAEARFFLDAWPDSTWPTPDSLKSASAAAEMAAESPRAGGTIAKPVAGLTTLHWSNRHLSYAITWFALGLFCLGAAVFSLRRNL